MTCIRALAAPAPFDVWQIDLGSLPQAHELEALSSAEHQRAARFAFARHRRRYLTSHVALRALLARRCDMPAAELRFVEGPFGKPGLTQPLGCAFNLSHSGDVALVAIAPEGEIGVDVEVPRALDDAFELAARNFTPHECAELAEAAPDARARTFLRCWTRKEACLKALGSGLSIAPETFEAGCGTDTRIVCIPTPQGEARVEVHTLPESPEWVGAVARLRPPP
ncbi:MAG TPA: 4'-phosphopantetheinyl transferase superfamily protein [Burkholderiaceae bacterium]|nr:4'-phosphopantetheinyl transferase superfamily protein [Burkholderiaceae bacterium]